MTQITEKETFDKLRQLPLNEMFAKIRALEELPQIINVGNTHITSNQYYSKIQYHLEHVKLLEENGWKYEEFYLALEKKSIMSIIKQYNDSLVFPSELLDRARKSFPNLKFTPGSIELE